MSSRSATTKSIGTSESRQKMRGNGTQPTASADADSTNKQVIQRWGRHARSSWSSAVGSLAIMTMAPLVVWFVLVSCRHYDCSLSESGWDMSAHVIRDPSNLYRMIAATLDIPREVLLLWCGWISLQAVMYHVMPGPWDEGQPTPSGLMLRYRINGWNCWLATHIGVLVVLICFTGIRSALIVPQNWLGLFWISSFAGWLLSLVAYVKARIAPTHAKDRVFSGSFLYDLLMGIEHNPRIGSFDFKLFFNGRPGILAWTLINLCFAVAQYHRFGMISNSMILLNLLQSIYVIDFFRNEGWYTRTVDIAHEHFGFYLAWGDLVWLPFMYTLQGLFLSTHFVQLSTVGCIAVLFLGLVGYGLFRGVNAERDQFRAEMRRLDAFASRHQRADQKALTHTGTLVSYRGHRAFQLPSFLDALNHQPSCYLEADYGTGTGKDMKRSYLLVTGFWGLARHLNYFGDLLLSLSFCLCCGFTHLLPYFYIVFMISLLLHRVARDDEKCRAKYGRVWEEYCSIVQYKIIPYVY